MASRGPWSVKGIDAKAREAALQAARSEGVTLGEYLNRLLLNDEAEASDQPRVDPPPANVEPPKPHKSSDLDVGALERLTRRVEAVEAKSTLAITGIDQSVAGLLSRLEHDDTARSAIEGRLELASEELRSAQTDIENRISQIEADDTGYQNLRALKSLETALGRLAESVDEQRQETEVVRENALSAEEKLSNFSSELDEKLDAFSQKVDNEISAAEQRNQGATRPITDRLAQLEEELFEEKRDHKDNYALVSQNMEDIGTEFEAQKSTLSEFAERLNRAENSTDSALVDLEQRLGRIDTDIEGGLAELKKHLEEKVRAVATELASTIADIRNDMVGQVEAISTGQTEAFSEINTAVSQLNKRMKTAERRQNDAIEAIGEEFANLTTALDRRVTTIESRNDSELISTVREQIDSLAGTLNQRISDLESKDGAGIQAVTQQMNKLADALDKRVVASEERSAAAIREFSDHVSTLTRSLSAKQEKSLGEISEQIKASETRQSERFDDALNGVRERIKQVEDATSSSVSPIQKAMSSLATRLQAVEDFATPPGAPLPKVEDLNLTSFEDSLSQASIENEPFPENKDNDWGLPAEDYGDFGGNEGFEAETNNSQPVNSFQDNDDDLWADDNNDFSGFGSSDTDFDQGVDDFGFGENEPLSPERNQRGQNDFLNQARAAASLGQESGSRGPRVQSGNTKIPLIAAASVLALTAAGTAGYMMMRGSQNDAQDPFIALPNDAASSTDESAAEATSSTLFAEEDLAGEAEESPLFESSTEPESSAPSLQDTAEESTPARESLAETAPLTIELDDEPEPVRQRRAETRPAPAPSPAPPPRETRAEQPAPRAIINTGRPAETLAGAALSAETPQLAQPTPSIDLYTEGMAELEAGRISEGIALITQAAENGEAIAQYSLAKAYERGQGVPRDLAQSRQWTERSANGGNVKAMHDLAVFFAEGEGGPQSYAGAVQWFRMAADHGLIDSQYNLGILYEQGLGVTENQAEALYWFRVAQKLGDQAAASKVLDLVSVVTPEEAEQTAILAGQYKPTPINPAANEAFVRAAQASTRANPTPPSQGALVQEVQLMLNTLGYNAGAADGDAGPTTQNAIRAYQAANGLPETGQVTEELVESLRRAF